MVDLSDKGSSCEDMMNVKSGEEKGSSCEDMMNVKGSGSSSSEGGNQNKMKTCVDCGTTKTPLWRGGPAGPKSLCNACGIRSRKKRRALLGLTKDDKKPKKPVITAVATASTSAGESQNSGLTINNNKDTGASSLKKRIMPLDTQVVLQRPRSTIKKPRRKLGEEEKAALVLMALSSGSIFA